MTWDVGDEEISVRKGGLKISPVNRPIATPFVSTYLRVLREIFILFTRETAIDKRGDAALGINAFDEFPRRLLS